MTTTTSAAIRIAGIKEIRIQLGGVSRQRAREITKRSTFPHPVAHLRQGRVWLADDVDNWMKIHRSDSD